MVVDFIGTIIYKHKEIKIHYIKRKNLTQYELYSVQQKP